MTKVVRRGTKLFDKAVDSAENLVEYNFDNAFLGKAIDLSKTNWTPRKGLEDFRHSTLDSSDGIHFSLHIHSNLWFTWTI